MGGSGGGGAQDAGSNQSGAGQSGWAPIGAGFVEPPTSEWTFETFEDDCGLVLNGDAACVNGGLRLTEPIVEQAGSAFLPDPITLETRSSFRTQFRFHVDTGEGDGLILIIHNDAAGAMAIGGWGEDLGFGADMGEMGLVPSVGMEVDTYLNEYDIDNNHIAINVFGRVNAPESVATVPFSLKSPDPRYVWIDYEGWQHRIKMYISDTPIRPEEPLVQATIDLAGLLGGQAYFGFGAATGGAVDTHVIEAWALQVY